MDLSAPHSALVSGPEGEVLIALSRTTAGLTGRQVASRVKGASPASVQRALRRLVEQGVVEGRTVGRANLYTLNTRHLVAPAIETISGLRAELLRRLTRALEKPPRPVHASVFGSAARGDGNVASDIDLFVVRPAKITEDDRAWRNKLDALADDVRRWTGNPLSVAEVSVAELARLRRTRPAIVSALEQDAVTLVGEPARRALGNSR